MTTSDVWMFLPRPSKRAATRRLRSGQCFATHNANAGPGLFAQETASVSPFLVSEIAPWGHVTEANVSPEPHAKLQPGPLSQLSCLTTCRPAVAGTLAASPFGPGGPAGPAGPGGPCSPLAPCSPLSPLSPFSPFGPCKPACPGGPWSPLGPCGPGGPCSPFGPTGPAKPCSPLGPVTPAGPGSP